MLQFSQIKKMCCFKRAKFCIVQRKVKCRCILLIQTFNFLLRWLLTLFKVHIMLSTFKRGTIKSLILTLNMFKQFFFSISFDMVLRAVMLQGLMAQACKNSARLDVQCCRNSARLGHFQNRMYEFMNTILTMI